MLTISAFWSSSRWPRTSRRQRSIPLSGRYRQVSLYLFFSMIVRRSRSQQDPSISKWYTVYPNKYAHGFVVLCFVVVMQSFIMNSHEVIIHIHQGCFAGTGAIVRLLQFQWSKPDGYGKISQCITTTKHSKAKTVCIFLGIYCMASKERRLAKLVSKI